MNISKLTTAALFDKLQETKEYRSIAERILDDENKVRDESYDLACKIYVETSSEYFHLGFEACFTLFAELALKANDTLEDSILKF
ncbi:MAG: hypothetical protein FWG67_04960 [Defluviitaleaceae bacterium]|nr:hypothetical protein [Defluviitaleaceae bacterium]